MTLKVRIAQMDTTVMILYPAKKWFINKGTTRMNMFLILNVPKKLSFHLISWTITTGKNNSVILFKAPFYTNFSTFS